MVVDDDPEFRDSVARLLRSVGLETRHFSCVSNFLEARLADGPTCLVLDVRLPGQSGLEFQRELAAANRQLRIIFITAHGDIPMTVQAMKGEPCSSSRNHALIRTPRRCRDRPRTRSRPSGEGQGIGSAQGAFRDAQLMRAGGSRSRPVASNKQTAADIGIAESTVKVHRTNLMRKMKARSVPELSRISDILKPTSETRNAPERDGFNPNSDTIPAYG
jgi:CheY-like chemotaxis protein/DNA-binding CsgD family transcriptional regulator